MGRAVTGCWPGNWCFDGSIVSPFSIFGISDKGSPNTSLTSFPSMKSEAKQTVESIESAGDRVVVITFPCAMQNNGYYLNSSGSMARQPLLEDIMSLPLRTTGIPLSSHKVKDSKKQYW